MRILRRGDTGSDVRLVQTALVRAGYDPGSVNGVFGSMTERAVIQFQRVLGLREDGIVGPDTWAFLEPFSTETDPYVLRRGSRGAAVEALQDALDNAGYDPGVRDGLFGTRTQAAVRSFQRAAGLEQTGVVTGEVWLALAPYLDDDLITLRRGDRGVFVSILQTALRNAGFDPGTVDGVFGPRTLAAVRSFQRENNLVVDGIVGRRTWAKLLPFVDSQPYILYTVVRGDTLSDIARRYNTTVAALLELNPRSNPDLIIVGEELRIPVVPAT